MKRTDFLNKRIRLQRLSDARISTGWVAGLNKNIIVVRLNGSQFLRSGDMVYCEVEGEGDLLVFQSRFMNFSQNGLIFEITEAVRAKESSIEARTFVKEVLIDVNTEALKFREKVCDLSRHGMAFECPQPLAPGTEFPFTLVYDGMDITAKAIVRNCRKLPMTLDRYRIGAQIGDLSRLDGAKWFRAMNSAA